MNKSPILVAFFLLGGCEPDPVFIPPGGSFQIEGPMAGQMTDIPISVENSDRGACVLVVERPFDKSVFAWAAREDDRCLLSDLRAMFDEECKDYDGLLYHQTCSGHGIPPKLEF